MPDTSAAHLRDGPAAAAPPDRAVLAWLSPEQYFDRFRDRLPEEQWQIDGFLVDLEVLTRPPARDPGIPGAVP